VTLAAIRGNMSAAIQASQATGGIMRKIPERKIPVRKIPSWERADNKFAFASFALLGFMVLAGLVSWLIDKPSSASASAPATIQEAR
jgi:hypothetical protein